MIFRFVLLDVILPMKCNLLYTKKCEQSAVLLIQIILVYSGFHSHVCQYMQKVHTYVRTFAILRTHISKLWKFEYILNKANAYVFMLLSDSCYFIGRMIGYYYLGSCACCFVRFEAQQSTLRK